MNPTNEHREQAQRIIEREAGVPFDCPSIEAEFRDSHNLERLTNNIALALSSRDAEVREVLEGLATHQIGSRRPCWCPLDYESEPHTPTCLAARDLYSKLLAPELQEGLGQSKENSNVDQ